MNLSLLRPVTSNCSSFSLRRGGRQAVPLATSQKIPNKRELKSVAAAGSGSIAPTNVAHATWLNVATSIAGKAGIGAQKCLVVKSARKGSSNHASDAPGDDAAARRNLELERIIADVNNMFGKGTVSKLGNSGAALVETFPSGNLALDVALGGGFPKGRVIEIYGPESSGKTTIALQAIAEVQRTGGTAFLVDAEHAFDEKYAKMLGVNTNELLLSQPDNGEAALQSVDMFVRSKTLSIICIDSVSALTPRSEIEGDIGQNMIGAQARLMSQSLRKMTANASKAGCTIIFINQIRYKIGVIYGSPEVTSGGNALKFYASVRLDVRVASKLKSATEDIGIRVKVKVVKSKVSRPGQVAQFDIMYGAGISRLGCIVDVAEKMGLLQRKGAWYSYNDIRLGQGRDKVLQFLENNSEECTRIEQAIRQKIADGLWEPPLSNSAQVLAAEDDEADEDADDVNLDLERVE